MANEKLYQCPYEKACQCSMSEPCLGCEEFAAWQSKEEKILQSASPTNSGSYEMPANIKEKFTEFVASQKDIPPEFAQVVNDNFWDLI